MTSGSAPPVGTGRAEFAVGIATIAIGIAMIAAIPELRHCVSLVIHGEFTALRTYIRSLGAGGLALILGLMVIHAIVWYPSEIVTTTAGYVYGFGPGLAIAVGGWLLAADRQQEAVVVDRRARGEEHHRALVRGGDGLLLVAE
jgi:hypothetical protein